jgi:hypothetical protein
MRSNAPLIQRRPAGPSLAETAWASEAPVRLEGLGHASTADIVRLQQAGGNRALQDRLRLELRPPPGPQLSLAQRQDEGPQSFDEAQPGTEPVDPELLSHNRAIAAQLRLIADDFYRRGDFRWFFTYANSQVARQIVDNVSVFQRPNALLRLNIHFAEAYLRAAEGNGSDVWRQAFEICSRLEIASEVVDELRGEVELCGATMASVHIQVDLANALEAVGCIPPADFSNMLVLANRGALAALVRLRGRAVGAAEAMLNALVGPALGLDVKAWRNAAYQSVCNTPVPPVERGFGRGLTP